jgi:hypothetical protein
MTTLQDAIVERQVHERQAAALQVACIERQHLIRMAGGASINE